MPGDGQGGDGGENVTSFTVDALKEAGIPDSFLANGTPDFKAIAASITEGATLKTQAEERARLIPADGKYDFGLPADWKAPEGASADYVKSWKPDETFTAAIGGLAKEMGLSQAQLGQLVGAYASHQASKHLAEAKAESDRQIAEVKALGDGGKVRLENLEKGIRAAGYGALLDDDSTLAQRLEAFEKIINSGPKMAAKPGANGKERPEFEGLTGAQLHRMAIQESART